MPESTSLTHFEIFGHEPGKRSILEKGGGFLENREKSKTKEIAINPFLKWAISHGFCVANKTWFVCFGGR